MLHAFIDESGDRGQGPSSSDHFVLSAIVVRDSNLRLVATALEAMRAPVHRPSGAYLTWKNIRSHSQRLYITSNLGEQTWFKIASVVSCKRHLGSSSLDESQLYLYPLRFLLERLSWLGRQHHQVVSYTMAHIIRFKIADLREYESKLRDLGGMTEIDWQWLDPRGGSIEQPQRVQELQFADLVASAIGAAFNPDEFGNVETRYLSLLEPRIYRYNASSAVTSYGLKMHPWSDATKAAYPWIATL